MFFLVVGYFALLYFLGLNMTETLVVSSPGILRLDGATSDVDPAATYAVYFRNTIDNKVCFCVSCRVLYCTVLYCTCGFQFVQHSLFYIVPS